IAASRWYVDERGKDSSRAIRAAGTGRACVDRKRSTRSAAVAAGTGRDPNPLTPPAATTSTFVGFRPFFWSAGATRPQKLTVSDTRLYATRSPGSRRLGGVQWRYEPSSAGRNHR